MRILSFTSWSLGKQALAFTFVTFGTIAATVAIVSVWPVTRAALVTLMLVTILALNGLWAAHVWFGIRQVARRAASLHDPGSSRATEPPPIPLASSTFRDLDAVLAAAAASIYHREIETQALVESRDSLIDRGQIALLGIDSAGVINHWSPGAERIYGYTSTEAIGRTVSLLAPGDDAAAGLLATLQQHLHDPGPFDAEHRHKDGAPLHLRMAAIRHTASAASEDSIIALAVDMSDAHRTARALALNVHYQDAALNGNPVPMAQFTLEPRMLRANHAYRTLFEISEHALPTLHELPTLRRSDTSEVITIESVFPEGGDLAQMETTFVTPGGSTRWTAMTLQIMRDLDGNAAFVFVIHEDITSRKETEATLQRGIAELEIRNHDVLLLGQMTRMLQACTSMREAYQVAASHTQQLFPNQYGLLWAVDSEHPDSLNAAATWGTLQPDEPQVALDSCWALRQGSIYTVPDTHSGMLCGHVIPPVPASYTCVPLTAQGEILGVLHIASHAPGRHAQSDTELSESLADHIALALASLRMREQLRTQSISDSLTHLFTRRYMEDALQREIHRMSRKEGPLGIILFDIDHFKGVNDTAGHEAGDAVLRAVGQVLGKSVRSEDIACRYGGEEFVLIMPDASRITVTERAEAARLEVGGLSVAVRGREITGLSVSAGIAMYPDNGTLPAQLLAAADEAMYEAKRRGRNRVVSANHPSRAHSSTFT